MESGCALRWLVLSALASAAASACDAPGAGGGGVTVPATSSLSSPERSVSVEQLPGTSKSVALTIDVERDAVLVETIIDTLADRGVSASFGITGAVARAYPGAVEHIARAGHLVMSHSDTHRSFTGRSSAQRLLTTTVRQADLCAADAALSALIGRSTMPYWRPPYGDVDAGVLADAGAIGYTRAVLWTVDSLGWSGLDADSIVERVLSAVEPGAIILMHAGSHSQDGRALGRIIDGLRAEGYSFVTLEQGLPARLARPPQPASCSARSLMRPQASAMTSPSTVSASRT